MPFCELLGVSCAIQPLKHKHMAMRRTRPLPVAVQFPQALNNIRQLESVKGKKRFAQRLTLALLHVALRHYTREGRSAEDVETAKVLIRYFTATDDREASTMADLVARRVFGVGVMISTYKQYQLKAHEGLTIENWVRSTTTEEALRVLTGDLRTLQTTFMNKALAGRELLMCINALKLQDSYFHGWRRAENTALKERRILKPDAVERVREELAAERVREELATYERDDAEFAATDSDTDERNRIVQDSAAVAGFVNGVVQSAQLLKLALNVDVQPTEDTATAAGQREFGAALLALQLGSAEIERLAREIAGGIVSQVLAVRNNVITIVSPREPEDASPAADIGSLSLSVPMTPENESASTHPITTPPQSPIAQLYENQASGASPIRRIRDSLGADRTLSIDKVREKLFSVTYWFMNYWTHHAQNKERVQKTTSDTYKRTQYQWNGALLASILKETQFDTNPYAPVTYDSAFDGQFASYEANMGVLATRAYVYAIKKYHELVVYCNTLCSLRERVELSDGVQNIIQKLLDDILATHGGITNLWKQYSLFIAHYIPDDLSPAELDLDRIVVLVERQDLPMSPQQPLTPLGRGALPPTSIASFLE